jgi:pentatricopeptide repeat protein
VEALALYEDLRSSHPRIQALLNSARHSGLEFYSAMVQSAVRAGRLEMVETLLDDMARSQIERTLSFYESTMKVLAGKKHYRQALAVYSRLNSEGFKASPVTLSCLINFAAELGELDAAIGFFEQLASTSTPSIRAYMMALRVYSKRQDWTKSIEIFRSMQARGVTIDSLIVNSVLATGVAAGKTEATEALLHETAETNPSVVDTISYNTVLKGYAHQKIAGKALGVLDTMLKRGTKPNGITFNTVMDAAVRGNQAEDAWRTLESMRDAGLRPDKYTCTILLKSLHEGSTPKQPSSMIDMIQAALPHCDAALSATLFRSIIEVTARLNNASLLMRAFSQMQGKNIAPTNADYQLIIQTLAQQSSTQNCCIIWRNVLTAATKPWNDQSSTLAAVPIFTAVMEELAKKEKVEGMICAFETLSAVINEGGFTKSGSQKSLGKKEPDILEQCRTALFQAASRKQSSSPAFKRLLELAPEQGLHVGNLMSA